MDTDTSIDLTTPLQPDLVDHSAAQLRRMQDSDVPAVVDLIRATMNDAEAAQAHTTFRFHFACRRLSVDDGRDYYVLTTEDGHAEAVVGLHNYMWGPPENVWLAWFAVHPQNQGRGLGRVLLDFATRRARELGYLKLFIETYSTPEFAAARRLYGANGFCLVGHIQSYLPAGGDMVVYLKELTIHV